MIKIKNWNSFQSYKDRRPPWIRFHKTMLDDYEYQSMSDYARALLPMLWLLASEDEDPVSGLIRHTHEKIAFRLRTDVDKVKQGIHEIYKAGFIEVNHSSYVFVTEPLQDKNIVVTPETETETETEAKAESNVKSVRKRTRQLYTDDFEQFWKHASVMFHKTPAGIKGEAFTEWKKDPPDWEMAKQKWQSYYLQCKKTDTNTKHICRWLRARGWDTNYEEHNPKKTSWGNDTVKISQFG